MSLEYVKAPPGAALSPDSYNVGAAMTSGTGPGSYQIRKGRAREEGGEEGAF